MKCFPQVVIQPDKKHSNDLYIGVTSLYTVIQDRLSVTGKIKTSFNKCEGKYSQTCIKRSALEQRKSGLLREVTS